MVPGIVADDPYLYVARATQLSASSPPALRLAVGIHPSAVVDSSAMVHPSASIRPVVRGRARRHTFGADTVLKSRVTVGETAASASAAASCTLAW